MRPIQFQSLAIPSDVFKRRLNRNGGTGCFPSILQVIYRRKVMEEIFTFLHFVDRVSCNDFW